MKEVDFLILGGGLSGLGAAASLKNRDYLILEKNSHLLGHASSFNFQGYSFDFGTHICHSANENWLDKLNFKNLNNIENSEVLNFDNGNWIGYPVQNNLRDLNTEEASIILSELEKNQAREPDLTNYENWCLSVYGKKLTDNYYRRFTSKYWRSNMSEMSTAWLNGRILPVDINLVKKGFNNKTSSQAVFRSFKYPKKNGFQDFFSRLTKNLNVIYGANVKAINLDTKTIELQGGESIKFNKIINTLPLNYIYKIIEAPMKLKKLSKNLKYLNLITTAVVLPFEKNHQALPDWFYIYDSDIEMSRVKNISRISASKNRGLALQFETFRRNDEKFDYETLLKDIEKDCKTVLSSFNCDDIQINNTFSEYSYVVSTIETESIREKLINYLEKVNINTCGLYGTWEYMWSDKSFYSGYNLGKKLLNKNG